MSQTKYEIKRTNQFKKDLKMVMKRETFDAEILNNVVEMLANDIELPEKYKNHHWLLEYKKDGKILVLTLTRTGSHSDLFE